MQTFNSKMIQFPKATEFCNYSSVDQY